MLRRRFLSVWLLGSSLAVASLVPPAAHGAAPAVFPAYVPAKNEPAKTGDDKSWDAIVDTWFNEEAVERPSWATNQGIHAYDDKLEGTSREAIQR